VDNPNQHIKNYLLCHYFEIENPGFAVLLTGEWGCGKSWFVKNEIIKEYLKKKEKDEKDLFVYISLFGLKTCSDIDEKIFEKLHPILSSKSVKLLSNILKGAFRIGFTKGIDFDSDGKNESRAEANLSQGISLKDLQKEKVDYIIILDDIERCLIEKKELLGYINSFVEQNEQKN